MSIVARTKAYLTPLPSPLGDIVYETSRAAAAQSFTDFFSTKRGIEKLGPLWVVMFMKLAQKLGLRLTEEEAIILFSKVWERLQHVDTNLDRQEAHLATKIAPAAFALRLARNAGLTILYGRAFAHSILRHRDSLTLDELADAIVRLADDT